MDGDQTSTGGGKSGPKRAFSHAQMTARQRVVIEMLARGAKAKEIAAKLGITENGARKLMARALGAQAKELLSTEAYEHAAARYLLQHDVMLQAWFPDAVGIDEHGNRVPKDKAAADVVLNLMKQYAQVYGLNAPVKIQPVGPAEPQGVRPHADLVSTVLEHLDELAERMGAIPKAIEAHDVDAVAVTEGIEIPVTGE